MSKSLYTTIKETTPPTTATVGIVGQCYIGSTNRKYYVCTSADATAGTYTWAPLAMDADLENKLDKAGGTITGDLAVQGNLTVTGETTTEKQKDLEVEDNFIYTNANKIELTALLSGIAIYKNGTDIYAIAYDPATDSVKLGLGTRDEQGVFHFNTNEGSPVAVRIDSTSLTDKHIIVWDAASNKFTDSGKTIDDLLTLINSKVDTSTTINGKPLTNNIKLYGTDIELASDNVGDLTTAIIEANNKIDSLQTNKLNITGGNITDYLKVKNNNVNGIIEAITAPTTSTVGLIGQNYIDISAQKYYICTNTDNGVYTWKELTNQSGSGASIYDINGNAYINSTNDGLKVYSAKDSAGVYGTTIAAGNIDHSQVYMSEDSSSAMIGSSTKSVKDGITYEITNLMSTSENGVETKLNYQYTQNNETKSNTIDAMVIPDGIGYMATNKDGAGFVYSVMGNNAAIMLAESQSKIGLTASDGESYIESGDTTNQQLKVKFTDNDSATIATKSIAFDDDVVSKISEDSSVTYEFKDTLDLTSYDISTTSSFTSNNQTFVRIVSSHGAPSKTDYLHYYTDATNYVEVYNDSWISDDYKTITFATTPSHFSYGTNATIQPKYKTSVINQNGIFQVNVYKEGQDPAHSFVINKDTILIDNKPIPTAIQPLYKHELLIPYAFSNLTTPDGTTTVNGSVIYHYYSNDSSSITSAASIDDNFVCPGTTAVSGTLVLLYDVRLIKAGSSMTIKAVNASALTEATGTVGTITDTVTQLI